MFRCDPPPDSTWDLKSKVWGEEGGIRKDRHWHKIKDYFSPTTTTTKMMCNFIKTLKLIQCFSIRVRPPVCRKLATVSIVANSLLKRNRKLFNTEEEGEEVIGPTVPIRRKSQRSNTAAVSGGGLKPGVGASQQVESNKIKAAGSADWPHHNKIIKAKLSVCSLIGSFSWGVGGIVRSQGSESRPSRVSWLRWGELGLGGLLGLELLEGVECLVESESGWGGVGWGGH